MAEWVLNFTKAGVKVQKSSCRPRADREDFDLRRWPGAAMLAKSAMATGGALERFAAHGPRLSDSSTSC